MFSVCAPPDWPGTDEPRRVRHSRAACRHFGSYRMIEPAGDGSRENALYISLEFEVKDRERSQPLREAIKGCASAFRAITQNHKIMSWFVWQKTHTRIR